MRVTIIKETNTVVIDGEVHHVDCSSLPADFHALQWDGTHGEIEYCMTRCDHCGARSRKANEIISDASPYNAFVEAWKVAKAEAIAAAEAAKAEAKAKAEAAEREANAASAG